MSKDKKSAGRMNGLFGGGVDSSGWRGRTAVVLALSIGIALVIIAGAAAVDIWLSHGELSQTTASVIGAAITGSVGILGTYLGMGAGSAAAKAAQESSKTFAEGLKAGTANDFAADNPDFGIEASEEEEEEWNDESDDEWSEEGEEDEDNRY